MNEQLDSTEHAIFVNIHRNGCALGFWYLIIKYWNKLFRCITLANYLLYSFFFVWVENGNSYKATNWQLHCIPCFVRLRTLAPSRHLISIMFFFCDFDSYLKCCFVRWHPHLHLAFSIDSDFVTANEASHVATHEQINNYCCTMGDEIGRGQSSHKHCCFCPT